MRIGKGKRNCFAQGRVEEWNVGRVEEGKGGRMEDGKVGSRVREVIVPINVNFGIS